MFIIRSFNRFCHWLATPGATPEETKHINEVRHFPAARWGA
jgi:hypothetical protein